MNSQQHYTLMDVSMNGTSVPLYTRRFNPNIYELETWFNETSFVAY